MSAIADVLLNDLNVISYFSSKTQQKKTQSISIKNKMLNACIRLLIVVCCPEPLSWSG